MVRQDLETWRNRIGEMTDVKHRFANIYHLYEADLETEKRFSNGVRPAVRQR